MKKERIRPIALGIIWRGDAILVSEGVDRRKGQQFYRPCGGGIEFQERAEDAVIRELREELGITFIEPRLLGVLENIFTYDGAGGHEICFIYEGHVADPDFYAHDQFIGHEEGDDDFTVIWQPLSFFAEGRAPLYPDGLLDLLQQSI
jgi:ADP-ribose pyrophosphatase YjhB (NUDIX family)